MAFQIIRNNIVNAEADAIVNTANPDVAVGAGVDRAIYTAAGWDRLLEARREIGMMAPGDAAYTPAFDLHARYIIHTVGPAWLGGNYRERETVAECYRKSLALAEELGCGSIAFPLIATGTYGFPKDEALRIAVREISGFLLGHEMEVFLVVYDRESFEVSGKLFSDIKAYIGDGEISGYDLEEKSRVLSDLEMPESLSLRTTGSYEIPDSKMGRAAGAGRRALRSLFPSKTSDRPESAAAPHPAEAEHVRSSAEPDYINEPLPYSQQDDFTGLSEESMPLFSPSDSLEERLKHMDKTFQQYLFMLIDRRGLTDPEVYKKANIDRKHFSKIRSNASYTPSKRTALALAVALELSLDETRDLLLRAGLAFSPSSIFDRIMEYCIDNSIYDIYDINCILFKYDQPTLGA